MQVPEKFLRTPKKMFLFVEGKDFVFVCPNQDPTRGPFQEITISSSNLTKFMPGWLLTYNSR